MVGAIVRSRALKAPAGGSLAMTKWWKKKSTRAQGEIRMHLSMHEQSAVMPWLPTFPKKVIQRLHRWKWPVGIAFSYYSLFQIAEIEKAKQEMEHRF